MRIARSRGALSGVLLILLGLWGALVPLVGHYFNFVIGPDRGFDFTAGRVWLSILPGVVTVLGGFILIGAISRPRALLGAWMAMAGGAWFIVGNPVSELWNHGVRQAGPALGGQTLRVAEELAYYYGLGALILAIASFAFGRLAIRSVRDVELAREDDLAAERYDRKRELAREPVVDDREPVTTREPVLDDREPVVDRDPVVAGDPAATRDPVAGPVSTTTAAPAHADTAPRRGRFFRRH
jgi:hypothetical protein